MYWHVGLILEGARQRQTPKFKWESSTLSGEAYVRSLNWSGGDTVGVSGPGIRPDGSLTDIDRHGSIKVADLPYEVLLQLEDKSNEVIQSARRALALVNAAILPKMQEDS